MSRERTRSFFRGRELVGLVAYIAILLIGWPVLLRFARPKPAEDPRPAVVDARPLRPETGPEFTGLVDKTPMGFRENAAYLKLLELARSISPEEFRNRARRDVLFTHLWERPDLYRGVEVELEGTMLRTLLHESMNPETSPSGRLYEGWFVTPESRPAPYVVVFEEAPPGLALSPDLSMRVRVYGRFLKLLGYRAGDAPRAAPLLIGRIELLDSLPQAGSGGPQSGTRDYLPLLLVALFLYLSVRIAARVVRATRPRTRQGRSNASATGAEASPEALSLWLTSMEAGGGEIPASDGKTGEPGSNS